MSKYFEESTLGQSMLFLIVLIVGSPAVAILSNSYGYVFMAGLNVAGVIVIATAMRIFFRLWEARDKASYRLYPFYINLFLFYTLAYTFAVVASPTGGFIGGLHNLLGDSKSYQDAGFIEVYKNLPHLFMDCMYYSVVIMTTLGDGTITPKNIMKMVVVSHLGFTFYITIYGVPEHFSNNSTKDLQSEVEKIRVELRSVKAVYQKDLSRPLQVVRPLSRRLYVSVKGLFTGSYN